MNKGFLFFLVFGSIFALIIIGMSIIIYGDNVTNSKEGYYDIYLPSGTSYNDLCQILNDQAIIKNTTTFEWVASRMNLTNTVEPGKYRIPDNISNRHLISQLRNGYGELPVKVVISNINSIQQLAQSISNQIESDSSAIIAYLTDTQQLALLGYTPDNAWAHVLADTYQFEWDTNPAEFFSRMNREFDAFWSGSNKINADKHRLTPVEVIILASIIQKESNKIDEYPRIAGVYLNRLNDNWPLQADPTIKFALNQPHIKRVLTKHTEFDSPYNTYIYTGLPPGPICLPEKSAIMAVLNAETNDYYYFCAAADFSGYHVFAKTLQEHNQNARKYQRFLNENRIF